MRSKKTAAEKNSTSTLYTFLKHLGIGLAVFAVLILVFAAAFSAFDLPQFLITPLTTIASCLGTFAAAFTASHQKRENGLLVGFLTAIAIFVFMAFCNAVFIGEGFSSLTFVKLVLLLLSGCFGGVLGVNTRTKR